MRYMHYSRSTEPWKTSLSKGVKKSTSISREKFMWGKCPPIKLLLNTYKLNNVILYYFETKFISITVKFIKQIKSISLIDMVRLPHISFSVINERNWR